VVLGWLHELPVAELLRDACDSAIKYVLDGARTWRFDLLSDTVDSDERSSVGTKLQYHVIQALGLNKEPPLDTKICGVAVEIKGTIRSTWMIPQEGQCQVTLLLQLDVERSRFRAMLMRTHRVWLGSANQDKKRGTLAPAVEEYALEVVPWTPLPEEPLRFLSAEQVFAVFDNRGVKRRLVDLFRFLPNIVIPRGSLTTVAAGTADPMRRARETKKILLDRHRLVVLVGSWKEDREIAAKLGVDLPDGAWLAVPTGRLDAAGLASPSV
jgi:hypothetical protein